MKLRIMNWKKLEIYFQKFFQTNLELDRKGCFKNQNLCLQEAEALAAEQNLRWSNSGTHLHIGFG